MPVKGKAGDFRQGIIDEAEKQGVDLAEEREPEQPALPGVKVDRPAAVSGDLMLAEFIRPHFSMEEGERFCALEFSFALTKEHKGKLPKSVEDAWRFVEKGGTKGMIPVPDHNFDIYLAKDMEDPELQLGAVKIDKATVSIIKEIGKGASERVIRFSFHVVTEATKDTYTFAATQFGNQCWIEMIQTQRELALS